MKKKNTPLLLGGLAAIAAFFLFRKKANASVPDVPIGPVNPDDGVPPVAPVEPEAVKRNAPAMGMGYDAALLQGITRVRSGAQTFNNATIAAMNLPADWAGPPPVPTAAELGVGADAIGMPGGRTPSSWLADQGYFSQFPNLKIPAPANRGSGWKPYIDLWSALRADAKAQLITGAK